METKKIESAEAAAIKKEVKSKLNTLKEIITEEPVQMVTDEMMREWFPPADDKNYSSRVSGLSPVRRAGTKKIKIR